ncbi:MAG: tetratricopeptide repeat protein, partial [Gemmataceae bacterium]
MRARWILVFLLVSAITIGGVLLYRHLRGPRTPPLPELDLAGTEPAVRKVIEMARQRVVREPSSADAWARLGEALLANGFDDEAMPALEQAGRLAPREPRWPYLRARRLLLVDRVKGRQLLEHAVRLAEQADPDNIACKLLLAEALHEQGEHDRVLALSREVLRKEPNNPRAYLYLGVTHLQRDEFDDALSDLLRAADSPYTRKRACVQLAAVALRSGDRSAAEKFSQRAKELPDDLSPVDPYVDAYKTLTVGRQSKFIEAERLEAENQLPQSTRLLEELDTSAPDMHSGVSLGIALVKLGNNAGAEMILSEAIRRGPGSAAAYYALAVAQFKQAEALREQDHADQAAGKYRAAEQSALRAIENKPDHANAYLFLGQARRRLGRKDEARAAFRRAIACRPELAGPHLYLGELLIDAGRLGDGRRELQQAISLAASYDPAGAQARQALEQLERPAVPK